MFNISHSSEDIAKHCDLQWRSKLYLTKQTLQGTQQEKQAILNQRIKKFHLYNTPQLENHYRNDQSLQLSSIDVEESVQTIDFDRYEKSLLLMGVLPMDINYLGILFKQNNVQFKNVITLPNQGLQIYFKCPFERVENCLVKLDNNREKDPDWYKLKQIEGCGMVNPHVKAKIIFEPKPGSTEYLYECAKSRFIENQSTRIQTQKKYIGRERSISRSRSRSSFRSSSRDSSQYKDRMSEVGGLLKNRKPRAERGRANNQTFNRSPGKYKPNIRNGVPKSNFRSNRFELQRRPIQ